MASHRASQFAGIIRTVVATEALQIPPDTATVVNITGVTVSLDLSYADIGVTALTNAAAAVKFLESRKGAMRKTLAGKLQSHRVPILRFRRDVEGEKASRIDELLRSL